MLQLFKLLLDGHLDAHLLLGGLELTLSLLPAPSCYYNKTIVGVTLLFPLRLEVVVSIVGNGEHGRSLNQVVFVVAEIADVPVDS